MNLLIKQIPTCDEKEEQELINVLNKLTKDDLIIVKQDIIQKKGTYNENSKIQTHKQK